MRRSHVMSTSTTTNSANGPAVIVPKPALDIIDRVRLLITNTAHYLLRLYFSILLLVYFWLLKIFVRALQPLEPLLKQMYKVPAAEVSAEGIRNQVVRLLCTVLLYLSPLVHQLIVFVTRPLVWARDKVIEYVEHGNQEAGKQTSPKAN